MKHIKLFEQFISEALKASKPNEVTTIEVDMTYPDPHNLDDDDRDEMEATEASWKKFNLKVKDLGKGLSGNFAHFRGEHEVTGKKKDILAYLQSTFYEMDADDIKEYYPELLD